jgi:hypothetical protein
MKLRSVGAHAIAVANTNTEAIMARADLFNTTAIPSIRPWWPASKGI